MNSSVKNIAPLDNLLSVTPQNFSETALAVFQFQYQHNPVYHQYCQALHIDNTKIDSIAKIPFLPVAFFKKDTGLYEQSFLAAFNLFYGNIKDWCILALLPSYLERNNSSLVMMANTLIQKSQHAQSDFYLNDLNKLHHTLLQVEKQQQKTLLIGVTFALLDFAEQYPLQLQHTTIMETGGMKGRREELTRPEVHDILCASFNVTKIHSEYGMTELLSQAYSKGDGIFNCPPWMKIVLREEDDPLSVQLSNNSKTISGAINVIDLANLYSCSFIATDDAGKLHKDESFEVLGRLDNSDIRGCSLLAL